MDTAPYNVQPEAQKLLDWCDSNAAKIASADAQNKFRTVLDRFNGNEPFRILVHGQMGVGKSGALNRLLNGCRHAPGFSGPFTSMGAADSVTNLITRVSYSPSYQFKIVACSEQDLRLRLLAARVAPSHADPRSLLGRLTRIQTSLADDMRRLPNQPCLCPQSFGLCTACCNTMTHIQKLLGKLEQLCVAEIDFHINLAIDTVDICGPFPNFPGGLKGLMLYDVPGYNGVAVKLRDVCMKSHLGRAEAVLVMSAGGRSMFQSNDWLPSLVHYLATASSRGVPMIVVDAASSTWPLPRLTRQAAEQSRISQDAWTQYFANRSKLEKTWVDRVGAGSKPSDVVMGELCNGVVVWDRWISDPNVLTNEDRQQWCDAAEAAFLLLRQRVKAMLLIHKLQPDVLNLFPAKHRTGGAAGGASADGTMQHWLAYCNNCCERLDGEFGEDRRARDEDSDFERFVQHLDRTRNRIAGVETRWQTGCREIWGAQSENADAMCARYKALLNSMQDMLQIAETELRDDLLSGDLSCAGALEIVKSLWKRALSVIADAPLTTLSDSGLNSVRHRLASRLEADVPNFPNLAQHLLTSCQHHHQSQQVAPIKHFVSGTYLQGIWNSALERSDSSLTSACVTAEGVKSAAQRLYASIRQTDLAHQLQSALPRASHLRPGQSVLEELPTADPFTATVKLHPGNLSQVSKVVHHPSFKFPAESDHEARGVLFAICSKPASECGTLFRTTDARTCAADADKLNVVAVIHARLRHTFGDLPEGTRLLVVEHSALLTPALFISAIVGVAKAFGLESIAVTSDRSQRLQYVDPWTFGLRMEKAPSSAVSWVVRSAIADMSRLQSACAATFTSTVAQMGWKENRRFEKLANALAEERTEICTYVAKQLDDYVRRHGTALLSAHEARHLVAHPPHRYLQSEAAKRKAQDAAEAYSQSAAFKGSRSVSAGQISLPWPELNNAIQDLNTLHAFNPETAQTDAVIGALVKLCSTVQVLSMLCLQLMNHHLGDRALSMCTESVLKLALLFEQSPAMIMTDAFFDGSGRWQNDQLQALLQQDSWKPYPANLVVVRVSKMQQFLQPLIDGKHGSLADPIDEQLHAYFEALCAQAAKKFTPVLLSRMYHTKASE